MAQTARPDELNKISTDGSGIDDLLHDLPTTLLPTCHHLLLISNDFAFDL